MKDRTFSASVAQRRSAAGVIFALVSVDAVLFLLLLFLSGARSSYGKFESFETCAAVVGGARPLDETMRRGCGQFMDVMKGLCGDICAVYQDLSLWGRIWGRQHGFLTRLRRMKEVRPRRRRSTGNSRRVATRSTKLDGQGHVVVIVARCHVTRLFRVWRDDMPVMSHGFSSFCNSSQKNAQNRVDSRRWDR